MRGSACLLCPNKLDKKNKFLNINIENRNCEVCLSDYSVLTIQKDFSIYSAHIVLIINHKQYVCLYASVCMFLMFTHTCSDLNTHGD